MVTWSTFHREDTQILSATVQCLVATATRRPEFVHPCFKPKLNVFNRTFSKNFAILNLIEIR